jgi:hypothetical protein
MRTAARIAWLAVGLGLSTGCPSPQTTRLPTLAPAPNAIERRSLGHYDPLPDPVLGPETESRPREFLRPREPQRQAREGQLLPGVPAGPVPPGYPTGAYRNNAVVH